MITIDRDAAREAAARELAKAIYPREGWTDRFNAWLNDLIFRILVKGSEIPGGWLTIAVLLTLVVVAVVVAVRIARRTISTNRTGGRPLFGTAELTAAEHRATAERFAAEGNWSAAIRHRLRAVARRLEDTGVLGALPGRTASELAQDAAPAFPDMRSELTTVAASFNDVTYGERPGTESAYAAVVALDDAICARPVGI